MEGSSIPLIIGGILIGLVVAMLLRGFVCWYFKFSQMATYLEYMNMNLSTLLNEIERARGVDDDDEAEE